MDHEYLSMGKQNGRVTVYFPKGKRHAITQSESVADFLGNKRRVTHRPLQAATGLDNRQITTLMITNKGWGYKGELPDRVYYKR